MVTQDAHEVVTCCQCVPGFLSLATTLPQQMWDRWSYQSCTHLPHLPGVSHQQSAIHPDKRDWPSGWHLLALHAASAGHALCKSRACSPRVTWCKPAQPWQEGTAIAWGIEMDSGARPPGFKFQIHRLIVMWPWEGHSTYLCLSFFICNSGNNGTKLIGFF